MFYEKVFYKKQFYKLPVRFAPPPVPESTSCKVSVEMSEYINDQTLKILDPETLTNKHLKRVCRSRNIPLNWVTKRFLDIPRKQGIKGRKYERRNPPMTPTDYRKWISVLADISSQSALIARILWWFNRKLLKDHKYNDEKKDSESGYVILEQILMLEVSNTFLSKTHEEGIEPWICIMPSFHHRVMVRYPIPKYLSDGLRRQLVSQSHFVFSNKRGEPLDPAQVNKHFRIAGQRIGLKKVSSLCLRPLPKLVKGKTKKDNASDFKLLTKKQFKDICKRFDLISKIGRAPECDHRVFLSVLICNYKTKVSVRKLCSQLRISYKAVETQSRRWKKKGLCFHFLSKLGYF
jgi:hypothetical protein